jgi:hypothetical protein
MTVMLSLMVIKKPREPEGGNIRNIGMDYFIIIDISWLCHVGKSSARKYNCMLAKKKSSVPQMLTLDPCCSVDVSKRQSKKTF